MRKRIAAIAVSAFVFLLFAEGIARVAEWARPAPEPQAGAPHDTFLIAFVGRSACLSQNVAEDLQQRLRRAGATRASVLNLCSSGAAVTGRMTAFLEHGLPFGPQVVLSYDGEGELAPVTEHIALRRVMLGTKPGPQSILNSYLYAAEVIRTLTQSQGGWFAVLLPSRSRNDASGVLVRWSAETGAPVFEDRERLAEAVLERYRNWDARSSAESARSSPWPR